MTTVTYSSLINVISPMNSRQERSSTILHNPETQRDVVLNKDDVIQSARVYLGPGVTWLEMCKGEENSVFQLGLSASSMDKMWKANEYLNCLIPHDKPVKIGKLNRSATKSITRFLDYTVPKDDMRVVLSSLGTYYQTFDVLVELVVIKH